MRSFIILFLILTSILTWTSCKSSKGFPQSSDNRKKHAAIQKRKTAENKKRFQFLTRDQIRYQRYQPGIPF